MRCLVMVMLFVGACSDEQTLNVVAALPAGCLAGIPINEVRVTALGDFPAAARAVASSTAVGKVQLSLPADTKVLEVEGLGPAGLVAFGRSAPLLPAGAGSQTLPVAFGPVDGICPTASLVHPRSGHQATLLPSGNVLISGGADENGAAVAELELYLPGGDTTRAAAGFRVVDPTKTILNARAAIGHAVAVLKDGSLVITGGAPATTDGASSVAAFDGMSHLRSDGSADSPARIIDDGPRAFHSATTLDDGRVVLLGGCRAIDTQRACLGGQTLAASEIYDPATGAFSSGPPLLYPRWGHAAIRRGDGSIWVIGGSNDVGSPPAEIFDPDEPRGFDAGTAAGRAVGLPTGAALVLGGGTAASDQAMLLEGPTETANLGRLPIALFGHTLTTLEDGEVLIAGGDRQGPSGGGLGGDLGVYDLRTGLTWTAPFARRGHSATRLADGTVLLAGGSDENGTVAAASVYFHTPVGPFANLPPLPLGTLSDPILPRRPDRTIPEGGHLALSAPGPGDGGRPSEFALVAGMRVDNFDLDVLVGRSGAAGLTVLLGFETEADYRFLVLDGGQPVALMAVSAGKIGQSLVSLVGGCSGAPLDPAALVDGAFQALVVSWRDGKFTVTLDGAPLLNCSPPRWNRGAVGVGVLHGTGQFANLSLSR